MDASAAKRAVQEGDLVGDGAVAARADIDVEVAARVLDQLAARPGT